MASPFPDVEGAPCLRKEDDVQEEEEHFEDDIDDYYEDEDEDEDDYLSDLEEDDDNSHRENVAGYYGQDKENSGERRNENVPVHHVGHDDDHHHDICSAQSEGEVFFKQTYHCYPPSHVGKPLLEIGDRMLLPASAFDTLASLSIEYPMQFELRHSPITTPDPNVLLNLPVSRCGVLEFTAVEGMAVVPSWKMDLMGLEAGDLVELTSVAIPRCTYVKLQPHSMEFLDVDDPKATLEWGLRVLTSLKMGESVTIEDARKRKHRFDILETRPSTVVSIVETDCEVDFAPPLDYKEPRKEMPLAEYSPAPKKVTHINGTELERREEEKEKEKEKKGGRFRTFTGFGRRLDGKTVEVCQDKSNHSSTGKTAKLQVPHPQKNEAEKEKSPFQPFTGKKYTVLGI